MSQSQIRVGRSGVRSWAHPMVGKKVWKDVGDRVGETRRDVRARRRLGRGEGIERGLGRGRGSKASKTPRQQEAKLGSVAETSGRAVETMAKTRERRGRERETRTRTRLKANSCLRTKKGQKSGGKLLPGALADFDSMIET